MSALSNTHAVVTGGHVRVSLLTHNIPPKLAAAIDFVATAFALAISSYAAWALILFAWSSYVTGRTSSTIDATPLVYPQAMIALGATLLALQFLARLIRLVLRQPPEDLAAKESYGVE